MSTASSKLTLATRKSPLALRQTELAIAWLRERLPEAIALEPLPMTTSGDEQLQWSLEKKGGKGLFTSELEAALLNGQADLAVHSAKDLPTAFEAGLAIAGYLPRAAVADILVRRAAVETPALIATSSPRRRAQLQLRYPDAEWTTIRGNVQTRLRKLVEGAADATVLAAAGLERLGMDAKTSPGLVFEVLPTEVVVPAPGQGAIALQCRSADVARFAPLLCAETGHAVGIEKAFLAALGGGCQTPVGAYFNAGTLHWYHPTCGHQRQAFPQAEPESIAAALKTLLQAHGLGEDAS